MKVEIKRSCSSIGTEVGDKFEAVRYHLDPMCKVTLLKRIDSDKEWEAANEYIENVSIIK